ncbi:SusC/RagA family TonB-linked outer membrane protein [Hymenobacter bucti]|uniref:SusC/RagA family TonB-linked outer membrane protein n=1 Tax=Hymenobacter bucti TaxID=1844114 RepID=A0ABW4R2N8_9BACT
MSAPLQFLLLRRAAGPLLLLPALSLSSAQGAIFRPPFTVQTRSTADITVTGRVTSEEEGEGLPGVTVLVKGTSNGTATDTDGRFTLTVPDNAVLVFSSVGFKGREVAVSGTTLNVKLTADNKALDEVVVVGYGTQNRKDLTGSVASVKADEIEKLPVSSVDQALQGKVAGVQIATTSGEPGGSPNILIRGVSSITGGAQPLVVIDGFPVSNADGSNPLNALDPRDIESLDVLKDASATAIYGSRGSNGVILITTKRGKLGKSRVGLEIYGGVQQVVKRIEMMNAQEFAQYTIDGRNAGYLDNTPSTPTFTPRITDSNAVRPGGNYDIPAALSNPAALGEGTDWQDQIFRTAPISNYKATLSGGTDALKYSVSGGFFSQEGTVINTYLRRFNFKANLDSRLNDKIKVGVSLLPTYSTQKRLQTAEHYAAYGVIQAAMGISPHLQPRDADGNYTYQDGDNQIDIKNPLRIADEYNNTNNSFRMLANSYIEYDILRDLKLRTTIGGDIFQNQYRVFVPSTLAGGSNYTQAASANAYNQLNTSWANENTLTYNKAFSDNHVLNVVAGVTFQKFYTNRLAASAANFANDLLPNINGGTVNGGGETIGRETLMSYLARVNYTLYRRFLFTATIRRDGSSKFGPNNRWGNFPSASFAYRLTEENFMKVVPAINDLKFRVGYGLTGNNNIGNYRFLSQLTSTNYIIGDANATGLSPNSFANPNLAWEAMEQLNLGLDIALFKNRITLTADAYNRVNRDMLFEIQTPAATGLTTATVNLGAVRNRGLEFALGTQNIVSPNFGWSTNFNISFNQNRVLEMSTDADKIFGNTGGRGNTNITQVGQPIGSFYGRQAIGVFQSDKEASEYGKQPFARAGDVKWADTNNDGTVNDDDRAVLGSPLPKYTLGFNNNFTYKAFSLDIFTNAVVGNKIYNALFAFNNTGTVNNTTYVNDRRWRSPEQPGDGHWGRAIRGGRNNNTLFSDLYVFDGSYLRIRNVVLNFTVPPAVVKRLGMQSVRLNVTGTNLFTFSDYPGYDPEVGNAGNDQRALGVDFGTYPVSRVITVGLNATF